MSGIHLVTGGAGFIGSHLVEALSAQRRTVRVLDNFSTGLRSNLSAIRPAPEVIEADLTDAAAIEHAMVGVEVVYHLGALASVQRSIEHPAATHAACVTGTLHVLDAARRAGVRRVVYAASSSAYGGLSHLEGQCEEALPQPLSPYAAAKLAGEFYVQAFAAAYGLETVRLRFFNVFGPRQRADSPYSGVIALFIAAMIEGRAPTIHGDGLQSRDFTYVDNVVHALLKAADAPGVSGQVFNIGTGRSITVLDLVACLNRLLNQTIIPQHTPSRSGDVRYSLANIERARRFLGYEPSFSFEEGLERTLRWYRQSRVGKFHTFTTNLFQPTHAE
ncbi:MAG TPA: SDR family oxidoreductase [Gemmataceae bacterium]|jgi:UDP-glucose 4-epimerase